MIKKPGAFSRYMSNPLPQQHQLQKERNKENKNPNCTLEQQNQVSNSSLSDAKIDRISPLPRQRDKTESKIKIEYQKQLKELKQLELQSSKLRKENQRLRQDVRKANKTNQENICSYEAYIKDLQAKSDKAESYAENLKFCIIWMIEAYALSQDQSQHRHLLMNKLGKQKMSELFKKLRKPIQDLQLKKKLIEIAKKEPLKKQEYLIYSKEEEIKGYRNKLAAEQPSFDEIHDMLDTFDLQRGKQSHQDSHSADHIARKLFVNEETFGEEIGEHSISQQYENCQQDQASGISQQIEALIGAVVTVKGEVRNQSEDYLRVKKGDQIKLLKKVGDLWIAEKGCQIGYITQDIFM